MLVNHLGRQPTVSVIQRVIPGKGKIARTRGALHGREMVALPRLAKVLGILLILLLLVPFVLEGAAVATKYVNLLLPLVFLIIIASGIVFYYTSKRKKLSRA
jgi:hypothetical protein